MVQSERYGTHTHSPTQHILADIKYPSPAQLTLLWKQTVKDKRTQHLTVRETLIMVNYALCLRRLEDTRLCPHSLLTDTINHTEGQSSPYV